MTHHIELTDASVGHRRHERHRRHGRPVALRLLAATAASAGATWAMVRLGVALPGGLPTGATPAALGTWLQDTPVDRVAVRAVWAAATGTGGYLTAVHALAAGAAAADSARALRLADRLSGGLVRRLSITGLAASIGAGAVGAPLSGAQSAPGGDGAPMLTLERDATIPGDAPVLILEDPVPVLVLEDGGRAPAPAPADNDADQPVTLIEAIAVDAAPIAVGTAGEAELDAPIITTGLGVWIVRPGDSLWSIAEAVLQERAGTPADLEAVESYWRRLIETNRPSLADPANPDLLFTGQQLALPLR